MLAVFYILCALATIFVVTSLAVVRAHEKKIKESAEAPQDRDTPLEVPEEEFFSSPIYKAMEVIAHM